MFLSYKFKFFCFCLEKTKKNIPLFKAYTEFVKTLAVHLLAKFAVWHYINKNELN